MMTTVIAAFLTVAVQSSSASTKSTIVGTARSEVLRGTAGADKLYGLAGNDKLYGLGGNDLLVGGAGSDVSFCGRGRDTVVAGPGDRLAADCEIVRGLNGLVMLKYTDSSGMFENFQLEAGGVNYVVLTNFYDGRTPLTHVVNLDGKESPVQFIQVANVVNVTGTVGSAKVFGSTVPRAVIHASIIQVLTHKDRGA